MHIVGGWTDAPAERASFSLSQHPASGLRDHVGEIKLEVPESPVIGTRGVDTLVGHGGDIVRARVSETFDFEGEIAVVIGRGGRHIAEQDVPDHVGGCTCFMDGSIRAYQKHSITAGKNSRQARPAASERAARRRCG